MKNFKLFFSFLKQMSLSVQTSQIEFENFKVVEFPIGSIRKEHGENLKILVAGTVTKHRIYKKQNFKKADFRKCANIRFGLP